MCYWMSCCCYGYPWRKKQKICKFYRAEWIVFVTVRKGNIPIRLGSLVRFSIAVSSTRCCTIRHQHFGNSYLCARTHSATRSALTEDWRRWNPDHYWWTHVVSRPSIGIRLGAERTISNSPVLATGAPWNKFISKLETVKYIVNNPSSEVDVILLCNDKGTSWVNLIKKTMIVLKHC